MRGYDGDYMDDEDEEEYEETKGERREAERHKDRMGPIRHLPPGDSRSSKIKWSVK